MGAILNEFAFEFQTSLKSLLAETKRRVRLATNKLCFRCFSGEHQASSCNRQIKCSTCGDSHHPALLQKEKRPTTTRSDDTVNTRCTSACNANGGGLSCSNMLLVDVHSKRIPRATQRVYAIIDEQSNSSLISSELADELGAEGPLEKYYLSKCSSNRQMKYGRRMTGTTIRALDGTALDLPTLIECDSIPRDKREVPTPEMARRCPHLKEIAGEIPPFDDDADIHLLIWRDAPETSQGQRFHKWTEWGTVGPTSFPRVDHKWIDVSCKWTSSRTRTPHQSPPNQPDSYIETPP